jgi:CheY-like chemotaxis protein
MSDRVQFFGDTAKGLARNPLGILALFIVLVYGFASLVTGFGGSFTAEERLPLIYFLISFPVLVLGVFGWLVSRHSSKLFAPSDFKDEGNFVAVQKMQMTAVASLTAATLKGQILASESQLHKIVEAVQTASPARAEFRDRWDSNVLWVDDRPENNTLLREAFKAMGVRITLALSTNEALDRLSASRYAAIISDMTRSEGPHEGYVLLDRLRQRDDRTPLFFYSSSTTPEDERKTREHAGQGYTNNPQELFEMVTRALIQRQTA